MIIWLILGFIAVVITALMYCCLVAAGRADERMMQNAGRNNAEDNLRMPENRGSIRTDTESCAERTVTKATDTQGEKSAANLECTPGANSTVLKKYAETGSGTHEH